MNFLDIADICSEDWSLFAFLQHFKLIACEKCCCCRKCKIFKIKDLFIFKCCATGCGKTYSVSPEGYWFRNARISYRKCLLIMYFFAMETSVTHVTRYLDLTKKTVIDWFNFCREVCVLDSLDSNAKIGGPDKVVEIYESVFGRRKHHSGRFANIKWILGGVERNSNKSFFVPIDNRDSKTLCDIVKQYVTSGTTIIMDSWKGYEDLKECGEFCHLTVDQSITFKDPKTCSYTDTIEETWGEIGFKIPCYGTGKQHLAGYLATYIYFRKHERDGRFTQFLLDVSRFYP